MCAFPASGVIPSPDTSTSIRIRGSSVAEAAAALDVQRQADQIRSAVVSAEQNSSANAKVIPIARKQLEAAEQARVVQQVFDGVGRDRVSIGEVCRRLRQQGCPTSCGKPAWDRSTVWAMLRNPAYKGEAAFGKTRVGPRPVRGGSEQPRRAYGLYDTPAEDRITVPVPRLVDPALFEAVREQRLGDLRVKFNSEQAVTLVLAAGGYPGTPEMGVPIEGLDLDLPGTCVFHAGTKLSGDAVVTSGGRVLNVTAWAADLTAARELAYQRAAKIHFSGCHYRRDIAARLTLE